MKERKLHNNLEGKGLFMMLRTRIMMIILMGQAIISEQSLFGCITTFINDTNSKILLYNVNDQAIIPVSTGAKRRFGSQHERANFVIYRQKSKKGALPPLYTCTQRQCASRGNIDLKFSDIKKDNTDATQYFIITEHGPHASMTERLSAEYKSGSSV